MGGHPLVEDREEIPVHSKALEHAVALKEKTIVLLHGREILPVHLREHRIDEAAPLLPRLAHQRGVLRRDHHYRKLTDVGRDPRIRLVITKELLLPSGSHLDGEAAAQAVLHQA